MKAEIKEFNIEYDKIVKPAWNKFINIYQNLTIHAQNKQPDLTIAEIHKFQKTWFLNDKKSKKIIDEAYEEYKTTIKSLEDRAEILKKKYPSEVKNHN